LEYDFNAGVYVYLEYTGDLLHGAAAFGLHNQRFTDLSERRSWKHGFIYAELGRRWRVY
jgi:hypothetical protein